MALETLFAPDRVAVVGATKRDDSVGRAVMHNLLDHFEYEPPREFDVDRKAAREVLERAGDRGENRLGVEATGLLDAYGIPTPESEIVTSRADAVRAAHEIGDAVETIVGANRDPQFGPLLLFGLGGISVEVLEDTTVRVAPISESEDGAMLDEIDAAPLLRGARGRPVVDEAAVVETLQQLSQLVTDFPAILELDVNSLVARPGGAVAIDVRLTIDPETL